MLARPYVDMDNRLRRLERAAITPKDKIVVLNERLRRNPDTCPKCSDASGVAAEATSVPGSDVKCCCTMCYWEGWDPRMMGKPKTKPCLDCPAIKRNDMPSFQQLVRKPRKGKRKKHDRVLDGRPQAKGTVLRVFVLNPKKPNSGDKKVARIRLRSGQEITAYIPGQGLGGISEHSQVIIKGGGPHDTPGVNYTVIRAARGGDCGDESDKKSINGQANWARKASRSKYGSRKPKA